MTDPFNDNRKGFITFKKNSQYSYLNQPTEKPVESVKEEESFIPETYGDFGVTLPDALNPFKMFDSNEWANNPDSREKSAQSVAENYYNGLMQPDATVPAIVDGELKQVQASESGRLTNAGLHAYDNSLQLIGMAQKRKDGGFRLNPMTGKREFAFGSKNLTPYDPVKDRNSQKRQADKNGYGASNYELSNEEIFGRDHVSGVIDAYAKKNELDIEDLNPQSITPERFVEIRDSLRDADPTVSNFELKKKINGSNNAIIDEKAKTQYADALGYYVKEKQLGDKLVDMYNGEPIINYEKITDLNKFEEAVNTLDMPAVQKARFLTSFKRNFEEEAGNILQEQFVGSLAGQKSGEFARSFGPGNWIDKGIESLVDYKGKETPEQIMERFATGDKTAYDFLKENPFYSQDSFYLTSALKRVGLRTVNSFQNTAVGASALALGAIGFAADKMGAKEAVDLARSGIMAMAEAGATSSEMLQANAKYEGGVNEAISIGDISITDEDLYSVVGQVFETVATAGASLLVKGVAKGGTTALAKMTIAESLQAGVSKASTKIAQRKTAGLLTKSAINAKEAAKSLWTNSAKVKAGESLIATSLQGSFGSAGQALSSAYGESLNKGMSREDSLAEATGKATANGLATFTAMTLMNMVAPGVEKILMSPETAVGLGQSIKNTLANRAARKSISSGLTEVIADKPLRASLSKGVADAVRGVVAKEGVGGFIGAVAVSGVSEGLEEMIDTALATTLDAYMNNSPEARKELESGGLWLDVIKSGIMGAMMGSGVNAISLTSKDKKEMANKAKEGMNLYLEKKLPMLSSNLQQTVYVSQKDKSQPQMAQTIQQILQTGDLNQKVEAIANLGNIVATNAFKPTVPSATPSGTIAPTGTQTPTGASTVAGTATSQAVDATPNNFDSMTVDATYEAPNGTTWTRKNGQMGEPVMVGINADGSVSEMTTVQFASFVNSENKKKASQSKQAVVTPNASSTPTEVKPKGEAPTVKSLTITNASGTEAVIKAPVESVEELASYAYEQAHGKSIPKGKLLPTKKETLNGSKGRSFDVTSYEINGEPADLHSIEVDKNGNPVESEFEGETTTKFYKKEELVKFLTLTKGSQGQINSDNKFVDIAQESKPKQSSGKPEGEAKPKQQPKSEKDTTPKPDQKPEDKKDDNKPSDTEAKPESKPAKKPVEEKESTIDGEEILPARHASVIKKFSKILKKLNVKIYVRANTSEVNTLLSEKGVPLTSANDVMAATIIDGKPAILINAELAEKLQDIKTGMKHEIFHVVEMLFRMTPKGKTLLGLIDKSALVKNKKLIELMEKEYDVSFGELDQDLAFYEVMRAFIAGKLHGETFTYKPFTDYIKAFLDYAKKLISGDPSLREYVIELEGFYKKAIKDADAELGLSISSSNKFREFMSSALTKAKDLVKSKPKDGAVIQTKDATDEDIEELANDLIIGIVEAYEDSVSANDIFNKVVDVINVRLIDTDTGLNVDSKIKVFQKVLGELNEKDSTTELQTLFSNKVEQLLKDQSPVIGLPSSQLGDVEPIKKKIEFAGWSGIRRFVTDVREDGLTQTQSDIGVVEADNLQKLPFTNSYINFDANPETGKYPDHDLKFGDALESINAAGVLDGYLIYSHSLELVDSLTNKKYMSHRFMKSPLLKQDGKINPFFSVRQSQYSREFYNMVTDSNVIATMFSETNQGVMLNSPEGLVKLVFESLTSNRTKGEDGKTPEAFLRQGDKSIKFADIFIFVTGDNKDGTSPFYFKDGKIVVNTTKLAKNFNFINPSAISNQEQRMSVGLMVASTVRAAIEEEILHLATVNAFGKAGELVGFYDELESLGYFNDMIDQIREMQGIENAGASLTRAEKINIAAEVMSFTHQRATNGSTYGDEYQRLVEGMYARGDQGGKALATARQYGQTLNNILQARAATSFMSPKMQKMLEKLNKVKVELGVNQRLNNTDQLVSSYLSEQYTLNRGNMQKSIDEAFMHDSFAVEEFRAELKSINIPIRQVIDIDFESGQITIDSGFSDYYIAKHGIDKYDAILSYFSRLNESQVAKNLARSIKSSRQVMDSMRVSLDMNNELDNLASQLASGNFDDLTSYLENYNPENGKIVFDSLIQLANSFEFNDNISLAVEKDKAMVKSFYDYTYRLNEAFTKLPTDFDKSYHSKGLVNLLGNLVPRFGVLGDSFESDKAYVDSAISQLVSQDVINQGHDAIVDDLYRQFKAANILPNSRNARNQNQEKTKQSKLLSLLINKNTSIENAGIVPTYAPYIESVNNYNELVLNFDEIILNKNLTRVDDFGRDFVPLSELIPNLSVGVNTDQNVFGYVNQYPSEIMNDRAAVAAMRRKGETEESIQASTVWQNAFLGRYTSKDRELYPEKTTRTEANSSFLGEKQYNEFVIGRMAGATLVIPRVDQEGNITMSQVSYDDYYKTMGFQPVVNKYRIFDGYADPSLLNDNLLKYSVSDRKITLSKDVELDMRNLNGEIATRFFARKDANYDNAIKGVTEILFGGNDANINIADWFDTITGLIGYNEKTGEPMVVDSINGQQTFASKFADQMMFRMFGKETQQDKNLKDYIQLLDKAHKALRPGEFKNAAKLTESEKLTIIQELPVFLELVDAANRDIGLARKAYSRFRSRFLSSTINADIRLIQEQGASGIRANQNLVAAISESFYDIQAMFDVEWHSNYLANGGQVGYQGLTALQLMDEFSRIPSSATNEYFVVGRPSTKAKYLLDYFTSRQGTMGDARTKDSDGKTGYPLDNLIFNAIERPADKPSELDEEFNDERAIKANEFTETLDMMPQGYEGTVEQLEASRRKDLINEEKRMKSWATHSALSIFQSIPSATNNSFSRTIAPERAKAFFDLFAKTQITSATKEEKIVTQSALRSLVSEQMVQLSKLYGTSKEEANPFAEIAGKVSTYNHPYELLLDVIEAIGGKERQFVNEQRVLAGNLAGQIIPQLMLNTSGESSSNQASSQEILDSLQEDLDKEKLFAGTLFNSRMFQLGQANSMIDSSLFMNSPLFSMLIQSFPNLIIYQPAQYSGKNKTVSRNVDIAYLDNGDAVLYINNADGLGSSKQKEILEKLFIERIGQERANGASGLESAINFAAENIRKQIRHVFNVTPERIEAMVVKATNALSSIKGIPQEAIKPLIDGYRASIEQEAANKLSLLAGDLSSSRFAENAYGLNSIDAKKFFQTLLTPELAAPMIMGIKTTTGTNLLNNLSLVTEMFTNPEAYDILSKIKAPDADLITDKVNERYEAFIEKALNRFQSKEIQSAIVLDIALDQGKSSFSQFELDEEATLNTESGLTDFVDPSYIATFLEEAFEANFNEEPSDRSYRSIKELVSRIKNIKPEAIRELIDGYLLQDAVVNTSGKMTSDQISQAKSAIKEADYAPDFMYRYLASELINALSPAAEYAMTIDDMNNLPSENSAYDIIRSGAFPLLVENTGSTKTSSYGNLTSFYYGHSPLTEIFERNRKDEFVSLLASKTPEANNVLDRYINKGRTDVSSRTADLNVFETNDLISQMRQSLEKTVGVDNVNQAIANISTLKKRNNELNDGARQRIADIEAEIQSLQQSGRGLVELMVFQNAGKKLTDASEVMDRVASAIAGLVADKQMKLQNRSTAIASSLQSNSYEYIDDYNQYVTNVHDLDTEIKELIEFNQETPLDTQSYQDAINNLIMRRDELAAKANNEISLIADSIAQEILSNVVNGAFGLIPPVAEMTTFIKSSYMSGMRIWELGDVDVTSETPLGVYLNSSFFNKSNKTRAANNLFNPDSISRMLDGYMASPDLKDRIAAIISSDNKLFSQLKKNGKLTKVISKAVNENKDVFDREQIKKNVSTSILNSDLVVNTLNDEFSFGFGDLIDNLDNKDAQSSLIAESEEAIGLDNTGRLINLLLAERKQLEKAIAERVDQPSNSKRVLMQLRKRVAFNEDITTSRYNNRIDPYFEMRVNLIYDPSAMDSSPENEDLKARIELQMQIIQEAARIFIEREGEAMYRALREDVDVFGLGFDIDQNIQRVLDIANIRNKMERKAKSKYASYADAAFDDEISSANEKATQMFGVTINDMMTYNLAPVVIEKTDDEKTVIKKIQKSNRLTSQKEQMRSLALFIEDEYTTSVYMPTTTKLENDPTKTYLVYNQDAQNELKKIKEQSGATWSVDEEFKDIIFRAALNPGQGGKGGLKTQTHKSIEVDPNGLIDPKLAIATKMNPNTTLKEFIKVARKNFSGYFIKNSIGQSISKFAQGIGVVGTIKPINKLKDDEIKDAFSEIYAFASNKDNSQILQDSGMDFLADAKNKYSKEQQRSIVEKAYEIVAKENTFLDPKSKASHALLLNEAQLIDVINMLNSDKMKLKDAKFGTYIDEAIDSIGKLFSIEESIANAPAIMPYNLSRAILDLDLSHNYSRLFSILYASDTLSQLVTGAINPLVADGLLSTMTMHENALLRRKFSGGIGSYNEALNLVGLIDHGLNGASGRNRYNAEMQEFQNKMGVASKDLNNDYLNGAKAMLIASLKGIKIANQKDGGTERDYVRKVHQWAYMFKSGYDDYKKIETNENKFKQSANKLAKFINRIKPVARKQKKEGAATEEIYSLIQRPVTHLSRIINLGSYSEADIDSYIQGIISNLEAGLSDVELSAINKYSDALIAEFSDIYDAHRIANMFASRDNRVVMKENKLTSPGKVADALGRPYSILPLKAGFVRNPLNTSDNEFDEGSLSIDEFIGFERSAINYKGRRSLTAQDNVGDPLRPIDLNPFTSVDGLARDTMYRTFLAPSFNVIKKLMGNIEFNDKRQMVTTHGFLHGVAEIEIGSIKNGEYFPNIASYIMHTVEKNIRNDMPKLIEDSFISDVIKIGNISTLVRALFSVWQPITNGILPAMTKYLNARMMNGYSHLNWFGVTHQSTEALSAAYKHSIMNYWNSNSDIANFVKENSINSYKWKAEGSNIRDTQISLTKYYKENRAKYGARWLSARIRDIGEKSLDVTIGHPERPNVQAIFVFELFNELQQTMGNKAPKTIEEMFKMNPDDISTLAKTKADIMVSDFMGMSDKAKKAQVYNLDVKRPISHLLVSGLTRFGNHKLTTNANLMVYGKHLFMRAINSKAYDEKITRDAVENISGTLLQNILYHYAKAQVIVPVFTWIAAALTTFVSEFFDEDEPDESKLQVINERYYDWLQKITQYTPDGFFIANILKDQIFPYMSAYNNIDEGIGAGLTDTLAKATQNAMWETTGFVPVYGAGLGLPAIESVVKVVGSYGFDKLIGPDEEETFKDKMKRDRDKLREAERAFSTFYSPLYEPYEASRDMSAVFLNYMTPKDGYDGISTEEFVYGLFSQSAGTREGKSNQARRDKELGGWGGY
jgi:hypothetical protein